MSSQKPSVRGWMREAQRLSDVFDIPSTADVLCCLDPIAGTLSVSDIDIVSTVKFPLSVLTVTITLVDSMSVLCIEVDNTRAPEHSTPTHSLVLIPWNCHATGEWAVQFARCGVLVRGHELVRRHLLEKREQLHNAADGARASVYWVV